MTSEADIIERVKVHSRERVLHIVYEGTLFDLVNTNGYFDITGSFTPGMLTYPKLGSGSSEKVGDPTKTDIHRISVVSEENTFGTDIMVNLVEPDKGIQQVIQGEVYHRSFGEVKNDDSPSTRALMLVKNRANGTLVFLREIFTPSDATYSMNNHRYGHYDLNALVIERDAGKHSEPFTVAGTSRFVVGEDTLLAKLLQLNPQEGAFKRGDGMWEVSEEAFDAVNAAWKNEHARSVTKVDMTNLVARIAPAGRTWGELVSKIRQEQPSMANAILESRGVLKIGLLINFTIAGHFDPAAPASSSPSAQQDVYSSESDEPSDIGSSFDSSSDSD